MKIVERQNVTKVEEYTHYRLCTFFIKKECLYKALEKCKIENCSFRGEISFLEFLCLYHSSITSLPREIANLSRLKTIDLRNSQIKSLPREIGNLSCLEDINTL